MKEHFIQIASEGGTGYPTALLALTNRGNIYKGIPSAANPQHVLWTKLDLPEDAGPLEPKKVPKS